MTKKTPKLKLEPVEAIPQTLEPVKEKKHKRSISRLKRRFLKHVWVARLTLLTVVLLFVSGLFLGIRALSQKTGLSYYLSLASDFVTTPEEKVERFNGVTNVLVLGKGGIGHEAPELTDTMMVLTVNHETDKITALSLPRDIWIPELRAKLNSAYYWGNKKQEGGGVVLAKSTVEEVFGQPIHYVVVVDFHLFERVIDELGGIEVDVQVPFTDTKFPIPGKENEICPPSDTETFEYWCRYETISFEKGLHYMDAKTALKFVRSRNAEGDEGTDFARGLRQQLVIDGIKNKVFSKEVITSYSTLQSLLELASSNIETDIDPSAGSILARRFFNSRDSIETHTVPETFLLNPPITPEYDNLYVFVPNTTNKEDSWELLHRWIECTITSSNCESLIPEASDTRL